MREEIVIGLCCNHDTNGGFAGRLRHVSIGRRMDTDELLDLPCAGRDPKLTYVHKNASAQSRIVAIRVSGKRFKVVGYKAWYGNWCWDAVMMSPATASAFVNFLKGTGKFDLDGGRGQWCDKWESGQAFTADDFMREAVQA